MDYLAVVAEQETAAASIELSTSTNPSFSDKVLPGRVTLQPTDVLIGRGTAYNEWSGNKHFRTLVKGRRDAYNSATKNATKSRLAREFYDELKQAGTRFLLLETTEGRSKDIISNGIWYEVRTEIALDKIKLAFRQRRGKHNLRPNDEKEADDASAAGSSSSSSGDKKPRARPRASNKSATSPPPYPMLVAHDDPVTRGSRGTQAGISSSRVVPSQGAASLRSRTDEAVRPPSHPSYILPSTLTTASIANPQSLLFQQDILGLLQRRQQRLSLLQPAVGLNNSLPSNGSMSMERMARIIQQDVMEVENREMMRDQGLIANGANEHADLRALRHIEDRLRHVEFEETVEQVHSSLDFSNAHAEIGLPDLTRSEKDSDSEEDVLEALSALTLADFPRMSLEQVQEELATITNEEKIAALSDLAGSQFYGLDSQLSKRARRDMDHESIEYLIRRMKLELDLIPESKKQAFLEAQVKCRYDDEFSDSRFECFLRSEGGNPKVRYTACIWHSLFRYGAFSRLFVSLPALSSACR